MDVAHLRNEEWAKNRRYRHHITIASNFRDKDEMKKKEKTWEKRAKKMPQTHQIQC